MSRPSEPAVIVISEPGVYSIKHEPNGDVEVWRTAEENWVPVEPELVDLVVGQTLS